MKTKSQCDKCGTDRNITHHHIVPQCFTQFLEVDYPGIWKSRFNRSWICRKCHNNYEFYVSKLTDSWLEKYKIKNEIHLSSSFFSNRFKNGLDYNRLLKVSKVINKKLGGDIHPCSLNILPIKYLYRYFINSVYEDGLIGELINDYVETYKNWLQNKKYKLSLVL